ncbi:MAG: hypothetical protein IT373_08755, partial [Polyangiaceae bacterium]|nr:hypothetical protein [Polyangiaceae bacterium]
CIAVPSAACPAHAAAEGAACLVELAADACADGLYCAEDARCRALPSLCEAGCYRDADCAGGACAGGSAVTATIGRCVAANVPGTCWQDGDCPAGWTCANAFVSCAACAPCPSPLDYVGQCQPPGGAAGLGLVADAAGAPQAVWWLAVGYGLVPCPSFTLELREERTGAWEAGPSESGCSAAEAPPFAQPLVRATPPLEPADFAWRWVRARGSYYQGCLGATPDTCSEGPIEVVSEPLLLAD